MRKSADPLSLDTLMCPVNRNPVSIGLPSAATTAGDARVRCIASWYGVEPRSRFITNITNAKIEATNKPAPNTHRTGTHHFQLRDHHPRRGTSFIGASPGPRRS